MAPCSPGAAQKYCRLLVALYITTSMQMLCCYSKCSYTEFQKVPETVKQFADAVTDFLKCKQCNHEKLFIDFIKEQHKLKLYYKATTRLIIP